MPLSFRNIDISPDDPVEIWPLEGVITALERGGLSHRRRLTADIKADPWGRVARNVLEALQVTQPYGVAPLMESVIAHARQAASDDEHAQVCPRGQIPHQVLRTDRWSVRRPVGHVRAEAVDQQLRPSLAVEGAG